MRRDEFRLLRDLVNTRAGMFFDESELETVIDGRPGSLFEALIVLIRR